jgi:cell division protease FtsH
MVFLGRDIAEQRDYSERTAEEIDDEVRRLIEEAHERCRALLEDHRDKLDELATRLIEVETIEGDDLARLLGPAENRKLPDAEPEAVAAAEPPAGSAPTSGDETEDETPQGQPGLAWGQSNAAEPDTV